MGAEAAVAGPRGRVDERRGPRGGGAVAEVGAFGVEGGDVAGGGQEEVVDGAGGQAGAVDEGFGGDGSGAAVVVVGGGDFVAGREGLDARDGRVEGRFPAEGLEAAFQVSHQCVRVYDARREGFEHAGGGADGGLAVLRFLMGEEARGDGDGAGEGVHFAQFFPLFLVLGYDPFFRVAVGDVVARAEGVHHFSALDAEGGFE